MIARQEDILFSEKFFRVPKRDGLLTSDCHIHFPEAYQRLDIFFSTATGSHYLHQVKEIIDKLKASALSRSISVAALDTFYLNLNHTGVGSNYFPYNSISFQLFTDGVKMLSSIANSLELSAINEEIKKIVLLSLGSELDVCAPGCYTIIQNAYFKLSNNPEKSLLSVRTEIAQQVALELIREYNTRVSTDIYAAATVILEGNITHYVAAILNQHQYQFGIEHNPDKLVPPFHEVEHFSYNFCQRVTTQLTLENVVNYIIDHKIQFTDFSDNIRRSSANANEQPEIVKGQLDILKSQLDIFGHDALFNVTDLFDPDLLENKQYVLSPIARQFIVLTLISRLNAGRFIDITRVSQQLQLETNINLVYFPGRPLSMSYVTIDESSRLPLVVYGFEKFKISGMIPVELGNREHHQQLHKEICQQIMLDPISMLMPAHLTRDDDIMQFYTLLNVNRSKCIFVAGTINAMPELARTAFTSYLQAMYHREKVTSVERLGHCINTSIVAINFTFSTLDEISRVSLLVDNVSDLKDILSLTKEPMRYQLLLMIKPGRLKALLSKIQLNDIQVLLLYFSHELRFQLLLNFHYCANVLSAINTAEALGAIMSALPANHYHNVALCMLGREKLHAIVPDVASLLRLLFIIPVSNRMTFIELISLSYCFELSGDDIASYGLIFSALSLPDQMNLLNKYYGGNLRQFFQKVTDLTAFISSFSVEGKNEFVLGLPPECLQLICSTVHDLLNLFCVISSSHYEDLIYFVGESHVKRMLPDYNSLSLFLNGLPSTDGNSFVSAFSSILSREELENYHGGSDDTYNYLLQHQPFSIISQATSYVGSLFYPAQKPAPWRSSGIVYHV